jgi:Tfp pilus assembly protein PilE
MRRPRSNQTGSNETMTSNKREQSFTIVELVVIIIIIGTIASLAIPRLVRVIEFSRASEAFAALSAMRTAMERCYMMRNGSYVGCSSFGTIGLDDPASSPGTHFTYTIVSGTLSATGYTLRAVRNTSHGGDTASTIEITQTSTALTRSGTGAFSGID